MERDALEGMMQQLPTLLATLPRLGSRRDLLPSIQGSVPPAGFAGVVSVTVHELPTGTSVAAVASPADAVQG